MNRWWSGSWVCRVVMLVMGLGGVGCEEPGASGRGASVRAQALENPPFILSDATRVLPPHS